MENIQCCLNCGEKLDTKDYLYCPYCGSDLSKQDKNLLDLLCLYSDVHCSDNLINALKCNLDFQKKGDSPVTEIRFCRFIQITNIPFDDDSQLKGTPDLVINLIMDEKKLTKFYKLKCANCFKEYGAYDSLYCSFGSNYFLAAKVLTEIFLGVLDKGDDFIPVCITWSDVYGEYVFDGSNPSGRKRNSIENTSTVIPSSLPNDEGSTVCRKNSGWIKWGYAILFLIAIATYSTYDFNDSKEIVRNNPLDSSVHQVEKYLKKNILDPDSYDPIEWSAVQKIQNGVDYSFYVRHKFRAKNTFGGYVIENKIFYLDINGEVVKVEDYE